MFRTALSVPLRPLAASRSFVSTVLLTRNWENETVNALKKEAKVRGLLQTGNKATLISRLQQFERDQHEASVPPTPVQPQVRRASTTSEVPGVPSSSQPTPIPPSYPKNFLDVKIPDGYHPVPEIPVQVPFVPDLWDSSRIKAESAPQNPVDPSVPKFVAVGGAETHYGGGPQHALYPEASSGPVESPADQSFVHDLLDDLLLPKTLKFPAHDIPKELLEGVAEETEISGRKSDVQYSRTLDDDEKQGVLALFGILAGSWIVAWFFTPTPAFSSAPTTAAAEAAVGEEAAEKR